MSVITGSADRAGATPTVQAFGMAATHQGAPATSGASGDSVALIEDEVRDQLRLRGIDPGVDPDAVRSVISEVVAATGMARARAGLAPTDNSAHEAKAVFDAIAGYGPLQAYLDDPSVEEIWLNEPDCVG